MAERETGPVEARETGAAEAPVLVCSLGCLPGQVAGLLDGREHLSPPLDGDICDLLTAELRRQGVRCQVEPA